MNDDWPFGKGAANDGKAAATGDDDGLSVGDLPDLQISEYAALPDHGVGYYNLPDAALLVALELHWKGQSDVPVTGSIEDDWTSELLSALSPLASKVGGLLARSVEAGEVKAEVLRRDFTTAAAVPERTFITSKAIRDWMVLRGLPWGMAMDRNLAWDADMSWQFAAQVARTRFAFRNPDVGQAEEGADSQLSSDEKDDEIRRLRAMLYAEQARRRSRLTGPSRIGAISADPAFGTKERNTLLCIIAGLCKEANIDPASESAAVAIEAATDAAGARVGEKTIRKHLRLIRDVISDRGR